MSGSSGRSPVVLLGFDAMDPGLTGTWAREGRLPVFAELLASAKRCPIRNPPGLFVGSLWSTFYTACSPARTGFHCWEQLLPGSYEKRLTSPSDVEGTPFWQTLSDAGMRVGVLDVPHTFPPETLNGVMVSEWGCHDRHLGLRTHPPQLAHDLVAEFGVHPVLGADTWATRTWAPDDYVYRDGPLRSAEEEEQLLAAMLAGARAKTSLSRALLEQDRFDLFLSVFGEAHSIGHQSWHVRDPQHPRHDPALLQRIGDPLQKVYEEMDRALGRHLEVLDDETTLLVLLSHGIGPHHDGTHLLAEILRRLDRAYSGNRDRSWGGRTMGAAWLAAPTPARALSASGLATVLQSQARRRALRPVPEEDNEAERRRQRFFLAPNNFVVGGVRFNLRGREPQGLVSAGSELESLRRRLTRDLLALVNVETGGPVLRHVEPTEMHYVRGEVDGLPDLLLEWNHDGPIETIWSPTCGLIHGLYAHWRTGDHRPGGLLLARGPGIAEGEQAAELAIEDLASSISARLGVALDGVDGRPASWLADAPALSRSAC